jgi:hypothetical protein
LFQHLNAMKSDIPAQQESSKNKHRRALSTTGQRLSPT